MKQSSKRLVSMVAALGLLVAGLIIFFDLISPAYGDLQNKKGQQESEQQFLASEQQVVTQAKNLLTQYENETAAQQNLALAMPSGPDVAGALAQVYGIAFESGLTVGSISISANAAQIGSSPVSASTPVTAGQLVKQMGTVSFQLSLTGSYEAMKTFLTTIESNIRIFDVTNFSLQPVAVVQLKGASQDNFSATVSVTTYYQLP